MSAALVPVSESLFQIEDDLNALLNSVDLCETEEQREQIKDEIAAVVTRAVAKRDQVAAWLGREESSLGAIDAEIARLKGLREKRCRAIEKVEEYVLNVILQLDPDKKGRFPRLVGNTSQFSAKRNPASVEITNEDLIPERYETITLQFSPDEWAEFTGDLDVDLYAKLADYIKSRAASKSAIKRALDAGETVPGAELAPVKYRLVRE